MASGLINGTAADLRLNSGTTQLSIASGVFLEGVSVIGNEFRVADPGDYIAQVALRPAAVNEDHEFTVQIWDDTAAAVLGSATMRALSGARSEVQQVMIPITVAAAVNDLQVRIVIANVNAPDAITLLNPQFTLLVSPVGTTGQFQNAQGGCATATLAMPNQPIATNTITIGADIYEFDGVGVNINVVIGAAAADTRANLIAAINTQGTEDVVADEIGTGVRIRSADAPGGNPVGADPNILLAEAITDAADVWDVGNVNLNTLGGEVPAQAIGQSTLAITADMITAGAVRIDFPFTVLGYILIGKTAAGVFANGGADDSAIANGGVVVTLNGGVGDYAATDVLTVIAWG